MAGTRIRHRLFAWGFVDQAFSSATTFTFTIVGARTLGPAGLGTVALGYAAFLIALGLERSIVVDPLLARISTSTRSAQDAFRGALSATVAGGLALTVAALSIGITFSGAGADGMLVFAPWFVPALSQGLFRAWLYREGRGSASTVSSAAWLVIMLLAFALGLRSTEWQITAAWGLGACVALGVAAARTPGVGVAPPRSALQWLRHEAVGLGSWRAASTFFYSAASYARIAGLSAILGPAAVGGYRAIETVFSPASLVGPALNYPGLPTMRDAVEQRAEDAWSIALKMSAASFALVSGYVVAATLGQDVILRVYGSEFQEYDYLIAPIATGVVLGSVGTGFGILLLAARKMREIAVLVVVTSMLTLGLALPLAALSGLEAAAWGIALAEIPLISLTVVFARRSLGATHSQVMGAG